jgi:hypothetical protein
MVHENSVPGVASPEALSLRHSLRSRQRVRPALCHSCLISPWKTEKHCHAVSSKGDISELLSAGGCQKARFRVWHGVKVTSRAPAWCQLREVGAKVSQNRCQNHFEGAVCETPGGCEPRRSEGDGKEIPLPGGRESDPFRVNPSCCRLVASLCSSR